MRIGLSAEFDLQFTHSLYFDLYLVVCKFKLFLLYVCEIVDKFILFDQQSKT